MAFYNLGQGNAFPYYTSTTANTNSFPGTVGGISMTGLTSTVTVGFVGGQTETKYVCRLCGGENLYTTIYDFHLCPGCFQKMFHEQIKTLIPKGDKNYCYDCYSHLKACKCEKSEALRNLKK